MSKVKPIPEGREGVIVSLSLVNADKALEFYKKAFGATAEECMRGDDGKLMHAELKVGGGLIMLGEANPAWGCPAVQNLRLFFYTENCDQVVERAVKAGCKLAQPVADQFWGDRMGNVVDPFGVNWGIGTHKEDLSHAEVEKRGKAWMEKMAAGAGAK